MKSSSLAIDRNSIVKPDLRSGSKPEDIYEDFPAYHETVATLKLKWRASCAVDSSGSSSIRGGNLTFISRTIDNS